MAELTRDVRSELRLDSYGEPGANLICEHPPYINASVEECKGCKYEKMNRATKARARVFAMSE